jgi:hypothetical protein
MSKKPAGNRGSKNFGMKKWLALLTRQTGFSNNNRLILYFSTILVQTLKDLIKMHRVLIVTSNCAKSSY